MIVFLGLIENNQLTFFSDKAFMGTFVNLAMSYLQGMSLEITVLIERNCNYLIAVPLILVRGLSDVNLSWIDNTLLQIQGTNIERITLDSRWTLLGFLED